MVGFLVLTRLLSTLGLMSGVWERHNAATSVLYSGYGVSSKRRSSTFVSPDHKTFLQRRLAHLWVQEEELLLAGSLRAGASVVPGWSRTSGPSDGLSKVGTVTDDLGICSCVEIAPKHFPNLC